MFAIQVNKKNDTTFILNVPDYPSVSLYYPEWQYASNKDNSKSIELKVPFNQSIAVTYTALAICDSCLNPLKIVLTKTITNIPTVIASNQNVVEEVNVTKLSKGLISYDVLSKLGYDTTSIYFNFNKYEIKDEYIPKLEKNAEILKKYNLAVKIYGYADMYGPDELNKVLSYNRAKKVADFYSKRKIKVIDIVAKGELKYCFEKDLNKCPDVIHAKHRKARIEVYKLK
jgi:outer membrane protein OmpA-like peptidoglycan-associated protein